MCRFFLIAVVAVVGCVGDDTVNPGDGDEISSTGYCADVSDWSEELVDFENEVLSRVNEVRQSGTSCGGESRPSVGSLAMDSALRCAARVHSADMNARDYFDHQNPEGEDPWDRMERAGYTWSAAGENISTGSSPEQVMNMWMSSPGHCNNIMSGDFVDIGVGVEDGMWTQVFGSPR